MEKTLAGFTKNGLDMEAVASARLVMVIGGPDTGKTTLARLVLTELSKGGAAALVDLDMGQSNIGPPTAIGWGRVAVESGPVEPEGIYFTGTLSPPGSLLPTLTGALAMTEDALAACAKAVIDTTGLVAGPVGMMLKQYKIELLRPDCVIALQRESELEYILSSFRSVKRPSVQRVRPPEAVRRRSAEERAAYRAKRLRDYFEGSRVIEVSTDKTGLRFTGGPISGVAGLEGRAVSLRRGLREDLALGIIEKAVAERPRQAGAWGPSGRLFIRTPLKKGESFSTVVIGVCSITL